MAVRPSGQCAAHIGKRIRSRTRRYSVLLTCFQTRLMAPPRRAG
ncbi:hypothetical protein [Lysobacter gummosus]